MYIHIYIYIYIYTSIHIYIHTYIHIYLIYIHIYIYIYIHNIYIYLYLSYLTKIQYIVVGIHLLFVCLFIYLFIYLFFLSHFFLLITGMIQDRRYVWCLLSLNIGGKEGTFRTQNHSSQKQNLISKKKRICFK